jgi:ketosteroid isomerase-like protein
VSEESIALVREAFEALKRGDFAWLEDHCADDLVIVQPPEVPDAKTYEGRHAMEAAMADWPSEWEDFEMDLVDIVDVSDDVVVSVTRHHGRGRESGIEMEFEVSYVQYGRDDKLARLEMYFDREAALRAARA